MATTPKAIKAWKDKGIFYVRVSGKDKPITYDLETDMMTSHTGRKIISYPRFEGNNELSHAEQLIIYAMRKQKSAFSKLDIWLSYPDLLENISFYNLSSLPRECPKGFVNWLKENNESLNYWTLDKFKEEQNFKKLTPKDVEMYQFLKENSELSENFLRNYLKLSADILKTLNKILTNSFKKPLIWNLRNEVENILRIAFTSLNEDYYFTYFHNHTSIYINYDVTKYFDSNRDIAYNLKNIATAVNKEKEKRIISQEDKIREIEKLSNSYYTIVVPSCLEDFTKEGKMQNNCVGYYYHSDIEKGTDFIYFIRKSETPDQSYITCRFNKSWNKTVEKRTKNNNSVHDDSALALIEKIDEKIRELLK